MFFLTLIFLYQFSPVSFKTNPKDRDYSGCPCRSWNGIVEYRCEVESVYRDQHLRRLVAVMHQDTDFAVARLGGGF